MSFECEVKLTVVAQDSGGQRCATMMSTERKEDKGRTEAVPCAQSDVATRPQIRFGPWALGTVVARLLCMHEVVGSNPTVSSYFFVFIQLFQQ